MPLLAAYYYFESEKLYTGVIAYTILHWFGDMVLFFNYKFSLLVGGISFTIGYITLANAFTINWSQFPVIAIFLALPFIVYQQYKISEFVDVKKPISICMFIYCCILDYCLIRTAARIDQYGFTNIYFLLGYIGYAIFMLSDFILILTMWGKIKRPCKMEILGTYMLAQLMLIIAVMH
ncbi:hypothetical protein TVAG_277910 [Trichomonas vaginalis G3]|uniref:YhhN-like protein n=1 Tax=Trichomonas vaginalis (strain ATCC PRA-98 / G3) TaxID=412133 RepID=A2DU32_TRIV3|nr:YhhN family [Trichomonas vaginalis G3]EAY16025.1 hypothetical protein TVAG_277910 [Trichomonas vaginalis G3]KAI5537315.1 YhhN family [Trichomonas vaginalis G3]|eukprot:XP_001328248.1 hypothetical protein [Trichomonas vaginalis G3]